MSKFIMINETIVKLDNVSQIMCDEEKIRFVFTYDNLANPMEKFAENKEQYHKLRELLLSKLDVGVI